ncbi:MAG TPA: hypothetical protein VK590_13780 [Saprospiraceae bacterium]|nr:hypothetical protein [Saprospiraceae bacterium]
MENAIQKGEVRCYFVTGKFSGSLGDTGKDITKAINKDLEKSQGIKVKSIGLSQVYDRDADSEIQTTAIVAFE